MQQCRGYRAVAVLLCVAVCSALSSSVAPHSALGGASAPPPPVGPVYGRDYAGRDYNVTHWNSPPSKSANHYEAAALECEALCEADPACCAWTYVTPGAPDMDPERCCLKGSVPPEKLAPTHWTGAPRGGDAKCASPPPPPPLPPPFALTNSPACLSAPNCAWGG